MRRPASGDSRFAKVLPPATVTPPARKVYRTRDDVKAYVFGYIERFYNPRRKRWTLGYLSPVE